jgi:hypothetical protein
LSLSLTSQDYFNKLPPQWRCDQKNYPPSPKAPVEAGGRPRSHPKDGRAPHAYEVAGYGPGDAYTGVWDGITEIN